MKLTSNDVGADVYSSVMTEQRERVIYIQTLWSVINCVSGYL